MFFKNFSGPASRHIMGGSEVFNGGMGGRVRCINNLMGWNEQEECDRAAKGGNVLM